MDRCPSNLPTEGQTFRRVEVLTGTPRRRRWSEGEKASIVAESLAPGAVVRQVALRHGLHPNQLYMWRRALASAGRAADDEGGSGFVQVALSGLGGERPALPAGGLEIEIAGAIVRVGPGVTLDFLTAVLGVVKRA